MKKPDIETSRLSREQLRLLSQDQRSAELSSSNEQVQRRLIARCFVQARRRAESGDKKAADWFVGTARMLKQCGEAAGWLDEEAYQIALEPHHRTGEAKEARRKKCCGLSICHRCHGRTHGSHPHAVKMIRGFRAATDKTHYCLVVDLFPPISRASYIQSHHAALQSARMLTQDRLWLAWADGWSTSLEITPPSTRDGGDGGPPRFHLHILAEVSGATLSDDVRELIATFGRLGSKHGPSVDPIACHKYNTKGLSPRQNYSPLANAKYSTLDGILEVAAAKGHYHLFGGSWRHREARKSATPRRRASRPATPQEVERWLVNKIHAPIAVMRNSPNIFDDATISLRKLDSRGLPYGRALRTISAEIIGDLQAV